VAGCFAEASRGNAADGARNNQWRNQYLSVEDLPK
jgi:hypothetical protein